jgi:hypothetical protein
MGVLSAVNTWAGLGETACVGAGSDIPELTGCPVASGLITIAITRMMPTAAIIYTKSFLSMKMCKNIPSLVINNDGIDHIRILTGIPASLFFLPTDNKTGSPSISLNQIRFYLSFLFCLISRRITLSLRFGLDGEGSSFWNERITRKKTAHVPPWKEDPFWGIDDHRILRYRSVLPVPLQSSIHLLQTKKM